MSDIPKSTLEIKVLKFLMQYGPDQLIDWIDEFDHMGGPVKFKQFKKVEKLACEAFDISIADMHGLSNTPSTNAKRIICFVAFNMINLQQPAISKLIGYVSLRSVSYYIKDVDTWINKNPKANKQFYEAYNKVIEKFNSEQ